MEIKDYIIGILFSLIVGLSLWLAYEVRDKGTTVTSKTVDSTTTVDKDTLFEEKKERIIKPDTVKISTTIRDTVIKSKKDTFRTKPYNQENSEYTKIRDYETTISDSLITGSIETRVQGYLISQNLTYTPTIPKITVTNKTRVIKRITKIRNRSGYPSVGIYTKTDLKGLTGLTVTGSWTTTSGNKYTVGYDPIRNYYQIGFSYNLKNLFRD